VCRLASQSEAENALLYSDADRAEASLLGIDLIDTLGYGTHRSMTKVAEAMDGHKMMPNIRRPEGKQKLFQMFEDRISCENGYVTMVDTATKDKQTWSLILEEGIGND
jgi:hypothetical protein